MKKIEKEKKELLEKLFSLQRFGIKPGLERTLKLAEKVGNPHLKFKSVHVAGTNGKGSVCSYITSILMEAGYKTGLYTSPHILDFNERIRVNGTTISNEELVEHTKKLLEYGEEIGATFFEITTVLAFMHFADNQVDFAIIEAGMGGRFDSTNIITPVLSVITAISLEHKEYLGDSIELIAAEKAGIIKKGIPVYIGSKDTKARKVFNEKAKTTNSELILINLKSIPRKPIIDDDLNMKFKIKDFVFISPLAGEHQLQNIVIAYDVIKLIDGNIDEFTMMIGFKKVIENTGLFTRFHLVSKDPLIILDSGHNPEACECVVDTFNRSPYKSESLIVIFSAMADKDHHEMLKQLKQISNVIYITTPKTERAADVNILVNAAFSAGFQIVQKFEKSEQAFEKIYDMDANYLICGSFFLTSEFLKWHKEKFS